MIFLENLLRYPRFLISSIIGLILVLLTPILKIAERFQNKKLVILITLLLIVLILYILMKMTYVD